MQAAEHARRFATAVASAKAQPHAAKPDQKAWLDGPFATELKTLSEMALGRPLPNAQQSLAAHTIQVLLNSLSVPVCARLSPRMHAIHTDCGDGQERCTACGSSLLVPEVYAVDTHNLKLWLPSIGNGEASEQNLVNSACVVHVSFLLLICRNRPSP